MHYNGRTSDCVNSRVHRLYKKKKAKHEQIQEQSEPGYRKGDI